MKENSIERTSLKYGIYTAIILIVFFFFMKLIGLVDVYELRMLNVVFLFAGVFMAIKKYRHSSDKPSYLSGIGVGIFTSAIALFIFSLFIIIYLGAIDPAFMESLKANEYFGQYLNPYIAGAAIFLEGTLSGLLLSFILMQYYKRSHMDESEKPVP
jgi:hypothetical protein